VSEVLYKKIKAQGFPVKIVEAENRKVSISVKPPVIEVAAITVPSNEAIPADTEDSVKLEEATVDVQTETPEEVKEEVKEEPVSTGTESGKDYESMTKEDLELLVPDSVKRPVRYGKAWLIKQLTPKAE
jgi:stress response protein YsnF